MTSDRRISVLGLGYVGLPVAVAFARAGLPVVGYDIDPSRVAALRDGIDWTGEVDPADLRLPGLRVTDDPAELAGADFHIVTVPTPVNAAKRPDFGPLLGATRTLAPHLKRGDIVVYESTVYPGATEMECVPVLEAVSGLTFGRDFAVGYSPERINPGDREHRFETILKVVSASDPAALETVAEVYGRVVTAGIHKAPTIAVAEAAKVIENTQRDINIALMNELAQIFHRLGIDTRDVLAAAGTKWNFLKFVPGLVGGHCIGVDPYYLTHRAEQVGHHPDVILAGRRINDGMGVYIAQQTVKTLMRRDAGHTPRVTVLGVTFKEDVPDVRNTRVVDIVRELREFGVEVQVHDPVARAEHLEEEGIRLTAADALAPADAVILAVPHAAFRTMGWGALRALLRDGRGLVVDVKAVLDRATLPEGLTLWRV